MKMIISNSSSIPIYEQIKNTIINQILEGELKDIKISAMTIKKAYDELEKEGYLKVVHGKGTFVAPKNTELAKEQAQKDIENYIEKIVDISNKYNISKKNIIDMIDLIYEEEN